MRHPDHEATGQPDGRKELRFLEIKGIFALTELIPTPGVHSKGDASSSCVWGCDGVPEVIQCIPQFAATNMGRETHSEAISFTFMLAWRAWIIEMLHETL